MPINENDVNHEFVPDDESKCRHVRTSTYKYVIALGVLTSVLVALVVMSRSNTENIHANRPAPAGSDASSSPISTIQANLRQIESALTSENPVEIAKILTTEAATSFDLSRPILPGGSVVEVLETSFVTTGEDTAYVEAEVSGRESAKFLLLLFREDDAWRLVATGPPSK